jgi:hypothetical protein
MDLEVEADGWHLRTIINHKIAFFDKYLIILFKEDPPMSLIYKVWRTYENDEEEETSRYELLADGEHLISHIGIEVPVAVNGVELTIHVPRAQGRLQDVWLYGLEDEDATLESVNRDKDLTLALADESGRSIGLHITAEKPFPDLLLECCKEIPVNRSSGSRER